LDSNSPPTLHLAEFTGSSACSVPIGISVRAVIALLMHL
jgi:hypothetical protein